MKRNNTSFVILGLIVLCAILTAGMFMLGQSPGESPITQDVNDEVVDVTVPDITDTPDDVAVSDIPQSETAESETGNTDNIALTVIEEKPKQPEPPETAHKEVRQEKPTDPVLTNPDVKPDSNPKPAETQKKVPASISGAGKPGQVWVDGFGWITPSTPQGEQSQLDPEHADFNKIIGY